MSKFRTLKINNITNADEHTRNLRNRTIYTSSTTANLQKQINNSGPTYKYNSSISVNSMGCLFATDSFDTYLTMAKGDNLCKTPDISYSLQGQMNEANLILVDTSGLTSVYSTTTLDGSANMITHPLHYDCSCGSDNIRREPGVLIDPSNILLNKNSCEPYTPYIYNLNPQTNQLIYDLSNTGVIDGSGSYYSRINSANNQLQNFYLSSRIKLQ